MPSPHASRLTVAAVQAALSDDTAQNIARMSDFVCDAASRGAGVVLIPELFEGHYFPAGQGEDHFKQIGRAHV